MSDKPVTPTTENPYPAEPVGSTAAHKRGAWAAGFAAGRAAATPDPPNGLRLAFCECGEASTYVPACCPRCGSKADPTWRTLPAASPDERLREAAQVAVFACLPVLHIVGSQNRGYRVSDVIDPKVIADPQEWVDAAHAICELHHVLAAADREAPDEAGRICCRGMGADGGCNICAAEATR